jgi:Holliday junction resolvase RusA-like endonuclease
MIVWRDGVIITVRQSGAGPLPAGPLALSLWLTPPNKARLDGDNYIKACQDALFAAYLADDSRVEEWHVYRLPPKAPGRVLASLRTVPDYRATERAEEEEMA